MIKFAVVVKVTNESMDRHCHSSERQIMHLDGRPVLDDYDDANEFTLWQNFDTEMQALAVEQNTKVALIKLGFEVIG